MRTEPRGDSPRVSGRRIGGLGRDSPRVSGRRIGGLGIAIIISGVILSVYHRLLRSRHRQWGARQDEVDRPLPGDEIVPEPCDETTRSVTVDASSEEVWPWVIQLGQGRGGFYSYSWLENLFGADIHNVDRIVPDLQELEEGDTIRMVREDYWLQSPVTSMTVERIDPGRTLVLQGHDGGTWTFHLDPIDDETTRFIVRGRKPETRTAIGYAIRYLTYELPHFIMERGMMLGIRTRAERDDNHYNAGLGGSGLAGVLVSGANENSARK